MAIVNAKWIANEKIFDGKEVRVYDWKSKPCTLRKWAKVLLELGPFKKPIACLVMEDVSYDLLISRPLMRSTKLNLHCDDSITFGTPGRSTSTIEQVNVLRTVDDVENAFPDVVCDSDYPPTVKFFEVQSRPLVWVHPKISENQIRITDWSGRVGCGE